MSPPLTVSVIVPVYRNARGLRLCLEALARQSYPQERVEIIVVQDEMDDPEIAAVCRAFPRVERLEQQNRGSYAARNRGLSIATGTVLAFTDSDCVPSERWIDAGVRELRSGKNVGIVGGHIEFRFADPRHPNLFELYDSVTFMQQARLVTMYKFATTANLFTYRWLFDAIGAFDGAVRSGGDGEWGRRAAERGYEVIFASDAVVVHPARRTLHDSFQKWIRVVRGFHDVAGKSGYQWAEGRGVARQLLWPQLEKKYEAVFNAPRLSGYDVKLKVFCVALLRHYVSELSRLRYHRA